MLRTVVLKRFAIFSSVSPVLIVYIRNVGAGVGVGRAEFGVGVGPAGVGPGVGGASSASGDGVARLAGSGTHAIPAAATASVSNRSVAPRIAIRTMVTPDAKRG